MTVRMNKEAATKIVKLMFLINSKINSKYPDILKASLNWWLEYLELSKPLPGTLLFWATCSLGVLCSGFLCRVELVPWFNRYDNLQSSLFLLQHLPNWKTSLPEFEFFPPGIEFSIPGIVFGLPGNEFYFPKEQFFCHIFSWRFPFLSPRAYRFLFRKCPFYSLQHMYTIIQEKFQQRWRNSALFLHLQI